MDLILLALYILSALKTKRGVAVYAFFLFAMSDVIIGHDYSYITDINYDYMIISVMYMSLCLTKDRYIKLSALAIVINQYIMAWDYYLNPTTETVMYQLYPLITIMLNLALLLTITRGLKDGFCSTPDYWYNDYKSN